MEIAELAQLNPNILINCLTKGDHNWRYHDSDSDLDAFSASRIRNTICKTIYGRLFTWIVGKINESLKVKKHAIESVVLLSENSQNFANSKNIFT